MAPAFRDALSVLTLTSVSAAILVGLLLGGVYLAELKNHGVADPIALLFAGLAFFVVITVARWSDSVATWDRNIGVAILWCVFCGAAWIGLRIRWQVNP